MGHPSKELKNFAHLQEMTECEASVDTCVMPGGSLCGHHLVEYEFQNKLYNVMFLGYTLGFIETVKVIR